MMQEIKNIKKYWKQILTHSNLSIFTTNSRNLDTLSTNKEIFVELFHLDGFSFKLNRRVQFWFTYGSKDFPMLQELPCVLAYIMDIDPTPFQTSIWNEQDEHFAWSLLTLCFFQLHDFLEGGSLGRDSIPSRVSQCLLKNTLDIFSNHNWYIPMIIHTTTSKKLYSPIPLPIWYIIRSKKSGTCVLLSFMQKNGLYHRSNQKRQKKNTHYTCCRHPPSLRSYSLWIFIQANYEVFPTHTIWGFHLIHSGK